MKLGNIRITWTRYKADLNRLPPDEHLNSWTGLPWGLVGLCMRGGALIYCPESLT